MRSKKIIRDGFVTAKYNHKDLACIINKAGEVISFYTQKPYTPKLKRGYMIINCQPRSYAIHRLLMCTFKPLENYDDMTVDHIDGNKLNNRLENLQWLKSTENTSKAHRQLGFVDGENSASATISNETAIKIVLENDLLKALGIKNRRKILCGQFDISINVLKNILMGRTFRKAIQKHLALSRVKESKDG